MDSGISTCLTSTLRAQRGLRELRSLVEVVGDLDHGVVRINDAQEDNCVYLQGDVVAGDDVLRWYLECFLAQRNPYHAVDWPKHQDDSRSLGIRQ